MKHIFPFLATACLLLATTGCFKDLDTVPLDPQEITSATVYNDPQAYKQVLAKLYAGFAVSGQQGPAGQPDISGIDEGFGQYLRGFWYHQELSTDEALIGWNDQTIKDFHGQTWTSIDGFIYAFYSRVFYQIALANEFIRETSDVKLNERNVPESLRADIRRFRAEARFLRALSYWHGLDLFRNTPFATEDDLIGTFTPRRIEGPALFDYIEKEVKAIETELATARSNEYGRADQAAAWMLLAKLYLNAEVYGKGNRYADCLTYCQKMLSAGYQLSPSYNLLFMADNDVNPAKEEIIFPINFDGNNTRTWGGMTFIIHAGVGGSMDPLDSGIDNGWGGIRTTKEFVGKFPADLTGLLTDFNLGQTLKYPSIYVPNTFIGFDTIARSQRIGATSTTSTDPNFRRFEGHVYFNTNNSEFLFYQVPDPSFPPLGDNNLDGKLETGGARIPVAEAGLYFIKADLVTASNRTYSIEKRTWALTGSATDGIDLPMTFVPETRTLIYSGSLKGGSFRFRANQNNSTLLGDTGADGILESQGSAINIPEDGEYDIYLDIDRPDYTYRIKSNKFDRRAMFYTKGQSLEIDDLSRFPEGYAIRKFINITSTGSIGKNLTFPDTDFPMFRLADVYLMAAEAILRNNGDKSLALQYVNAVRQRAYEGVAGHISMGELTLDFILDERARELYWECHRRTDLVRFGQFADGNYRWAWKGGVRDGATVAPFRNIYPIPAQDLNANSNLRQNPGY
jgi:hypothetical protein